MTQRIGGFLLLSGLVAACAPRDGLPENLPGDSTAPGSAVVAAPAGSDPDNAPVELLSPDIRRACASVADYWRAWPGAAIRRLDSTLTRPRSSAVTDACWVLIRVEEDRARDANVRVPFVAAGWLPLYELDADGKDGRSRVYQLDPVRCYVEERWDGGNEVDTTYVPATWFEQRVACFRR